MTVAVPSIAFFRLSKYSNAEVFGHFDAHLDYASRFLVHFLLFQISGTETVERPEVLCLVVT